MTSPGQHSQRWTRFLKQGLLLAAVALTSVSFVVAPAEAQIVPQNPSNPQNPSAPQNASTPENSAAPQNAPAQTTSPVPDQSGDAPREDTVPADNSVQGEAGQFVFRKQVEEVVLHATVVDQQNNLISNLGRSVFQVYEDGKLQQITSFHQEHVPIALGILIDNSGSMLPKRQAVNQAALNLIRASDPQDEIFVVNFGEEYYLDQDFTNDEAKLRAALEKIETRGSTALYDAVVASAVHMKQETSLPKRALLVVTDGADNASQETLEEALQQLEQKDSPVVYVIALTGPTKRASSVIQSLQSLSQKTGGTAYFPTDIQEVDSITRTIAAAIRSQYVIGYKSSNATTGHAFHGIEVQALDPGRKKLRVQTRTGYYSDSAGGS